MDPTSQGDKMAQPAGLPPDQPQSHCLRNCLIGGCLLVVVLGVGFFALTAMFVSKIKNSFTDDPARVTAIGQEVAPGATAPSGYTQKAIDISWFSFKAKGVILAKGDPDKDGTVIAYGALASRGDRNQVREAFEKAVEGAGQKGAGGPQTVEKEEEIDMDVAGEKVKATHIVSTDSGGRKLAKYVLILDQWNNGFGWLGIGAMGGEDKFDMDGFKAFLASLKKK
jgi:hypothetical protein